MSSPQPVTMRSLCVNSYRVPSEYEISSIPTPEITLPNHVLVKVHAASINPADMEVAGGMFKWAVTLAFPVKIGFDLSGTVVAIGDSVKDVKIGDEVFGCMLFQEMGTISEFALVTDTFLVPKPKNISHAEAASLPLVALTALQAFEKVKGGMQNKTVLITSGLGGVGSIACQMAKTVFGASKIITTVSTDKVGKVGQLLGEGIVDQVVDYKKSDPLAEISHSSVDVLLDGANASISYLPLLAKKKGAVLDISGHQSGTDVKNVIPEVSAAIQMVFGIITSYYRFRIGYQGDVQYETVLQKPTREGMQRIALWVEEGKLKPIIGKTAKLEDIQAIRETCTQISSGKGGIGKFVINIT